MKRKWFWPLAALVGALAIGVLCVGPSASADSATSNVQTFPDPSGDVSGGLDITAVTITGSKGTGAMTIAVTIPGYQPPVSDGKVRWVEVWLDTDKNTSTGSSASGSEYALVYYDDPADTQHWWDFARWNGNGWEEAPVSAALDFNRAGGLLTWSLGSADIGGATSFSFYVNTTVEDASGNVLASDVSPDAGVKWVYDIAGQKSMTTLVAPQIATPVTVPARPVAGKRLTVTFPVTWTSAGKTLALVGAKMVCDPSIAGKVIRHAESFNGSTARLSFIVPKSAKGKHLKLRVTIEGGSLRGEDTLVVDASTGLLSIAQTWYSGLSTTAVVNLTVR